MLSRTELKNLTSQSSAYFEPFFKVYTPDENTELLNDDGTTPFGRILDVQKESSLLVDPNWQDTTTAYLLTVASDVIPNSSASYWVEINQQKERVNFGKYVQHHFGYILYLKGD